ncbi:MAG: hypothetical protein SW833_18330 [Cyanobacteriota bacterium]|nr:hypothetical protein [Cyanobacteriota bacterium]
MPQIQKLGAFAAFLNVIVAVATLIVAVAWIGFPAMADPNKLAELAISNPAPLIVQDGFKFASVVISTVLILALANRLWRGGSTFILVATGFGFASTLCLLINTILSLYAISQAATFAREGLATGSQINSAIGILAVAALGLDGLWFLSIGWAGLKRRQLPNFLCYLSLVMGVLSLIPPLGIIVLLLGMIWSAWVGRVLWQGKPAS